MYAAVDTANSAWQLEPRPSQRGRTISSTSSHSSFALVSDQDISSFTASLESGRDSEVDDSYNDLVQSPVFSSPSSNDERAGIAPRHRDDFVMPQISGLSSPRVGPSLLSSFSSTESLYSARSGRLLTLHLEKGWPLLIHFIFSSTYAVIMQRNQSSGLLWWLVLYPIHSQLLYICRSVGKIPNCPLTKKDSIWTPQV